MNKKGFVDQLVNLETLKTVHERMYDEFAMSEGNATAALPKGSKQGQNDLPGTGETSYVDDSLGWQYNIAQDQSNGIYLPDFVKDPKNASDPAFKVRTSVQKVGTLHLTICLTRVIYTDYYATYSPDISTRLVPAMSQSTQPQNLPMYISNTTQYSHTQLQGIITRHTM